MLETIKNGFSAVVNFFEALFDFIHNIINAGVELFTSLPDIIKTVTASIGLLPSVLLSAAMFVVTVRIAVLVINHKAGE